MLNKCKRATILLVLWLLCCNWQICVTLRALPGIQKDTTNCVGRPSQSAHPAWYQKGGLLFLLQKESSNYLYQLCIYARVLLRHDETYKEGGFFFFSSAALVERWPRVVKSDPTGQLFKDAQGERHGRQMDSHLLSLQENEPRGLSGNPSARAGFAYK